MGLTFVCCELDPCQKNPKEQKQQQRRLGEKSQSLSACDASLVMAHCGRIFFSVIRIKNIYPRVFSRIFGKISCHKLKKLKKKTCEITPYIETLLQKKSAPMCITRLLQIVSSFRIKNF